MKLWVNLTKILAAGFSEKRGVGKLLVHFAENFGGWFENGGRDFSKVLIV